MAWRHDYVPPRPIPLPDGCRRVGAPIYDREGEGRGRELEAVVTGRRRRDRPPLITRYYKGYPTD